MLQLPQNKVIAHRGASAFAPENTIASFEKAYQLGARMVEFDVMLSADGVPVIFHDDSLKRTTNGHGDLNDHDWSYLSQLDAGSWFSKAYLHEKIPTFEAVINWLIQKNCYANIEIKPHVSRIEETVESVLFVLNRHWPKNIALPLISSFEDEALKLVCQKAQQYPRGLLRHHWDKHWAKAVEDLDVVSFHGHARIFTASRVKALKAAGLNVFAYTVNHQKKAERLFAIGVDAVFSDYPDLCL